MDRTFTDGTSRTGETYFVWEGEWWKHRLIEEEKEIFMPGSPTRSSSPPSSPSVGRTGSWVGGGARVREAGVLVE